LLLQPHAPHPDLHPFPTRRSADLPAGSHSEFDAGARQLIQEFQDPLNWLDGERFFPEKHLFPMTEFPDLRIRQIAKKVTKDILRSEEHTSELQSRENLVCRLLLEK